MLLPISHSNAVLQIANRFAAVCWSLIPQDMLRAKPSPASFNHHGTLEEVSDSVRGQCAHIQPLFDGGSVQICLLLERVVEA